MLRWPVVAGKAVARLFRALQDIDVFVEDQGDEVFYTQLFSVAAGGQVRISRVVGLGGRKEVLDAARIYADSRKALFLVDGDLSWVRGDSGPGEPRVYQLNCYCIENAIMAPKGIASLIAEEGLCSEADAGARLDFATWRGEMAILTELFVRFAILNQIDPDVATVGSGSLGKVIAAGDGAPALCPIKTAALIAEAEAAIISNIGAEAASERIRDVRARVASLENQLAVVSGKHFLLPLLFFRVRRIVGVPVRHDAMRFRLAKKCERADLTELVSALKAAG